MLEKAEFWYPSRYTAIKLLEGDEEITREIRRIDPRIASAVERLAADIERLHGHSCSTVITSERYEIAGCIARQAQELVPPIKPSWEERIHSLTTHKILGYPLMAASLLVVFAAIFTVGGYISELLGNLFLSLEPLFLGFFGTGIAGELIWGGIMEGIIASITVALPYIVPFYFILYILENSGYLSRIAFLMDNAMHRIGLHGKAFIPIMLGVGCNVPACLGCRIMETERERLLAAFVSTLVPCAARTVIILGLVGQFVGIQWALVLYIVDVLIIAILGRLAFKILPGEPTALVMEMHSYKVPHLKTVLKQTWFRLAEFIRIAFPMIIVGSLALKLAEVAGLLEPIAAALSPVTVTWLGLPAIAGVALIFGVLRKELTLIMLATLLGTTNFAEVLTPVQMVVFTLVVMLYVPCLATIAVLVREFGWKTAFHITAFEIAFATIVGGVALRVLTLAA
jgi:ferrous iron transport protein B